ncbi:MAG: YdbH domain-containing protein [Erythrobacter sp.]|uniref:intermembrane phospholipid transport protein YdbH family protein n=1 Tax=Erythrobacter sp. TaxID=1042 RepID=UPI0025D5EE7E|nr:YdbH domain-containing protein [Erythrobacter sp.]MCL9999434.1 YdbH domain-containing protein [Erythrobacter sp.]
MRQAEAETVEEPQNGGSGRARPRRRWRSPVALGVAALALVGGGTAWLSRERIAADVIDDYLAGRGVPATYDIVSLTPQRQVIENLVVGDPARPDLTVRRMVIELGVGWQGPEVRRVSVEGARVFARLQGGTLSLGKLDPLVFTGGDAAPALPAIDVVLTDARGLLESDYGRVGFKLDGKGRLDDGFAGVLAATAPGIGTAECRAASATLYGSLTTTGGAPAFDGPLRLAGLACGGATLARADIGAKASLASGFDAASADFRVTGGGAQAGDLTAAGLGGSAELGWSEGRLALGHDLALTGIAAPQGRLARLAVEGDWRGAADGSGGQWEGTLRGAGLSPATDLAASLAAIERGAAGTLIAPLVARARTSLGAALEGASFRGEAVIRHKGAEASLVIPEASLASARGTRVLALSRAGARLGQGGVSGLAGSLLAGGEGLPSINGRIAQDQGGGWSARLAMADYAAGANRLAIPRLTLRSGASGALSFEGLVKASGDLPGGGVNDLDLPLEGTWSQASGLALGTRCTPLRFAKVALSGLTLAGRQLQLCPEGRAPILTYRDQLRLAARTGALELDGTLGESPASFAAAGVTLRYPEPFAVQGLAARIGEGSSEVRLSAATLTGRFGEAITGDFAGGAARLVAVPFDLDSIAGGWTFADGVLSLAGASFTLTDRPNADHPEPRFTPMRAEGATLQLEDNRITADARLAHRDSGRAVANVAITHDLGTAVGNARLAVPGLVFDKGFQPEDLSYLAKGVIALAEGSVTGTGRIDWQGETLTSSGTFGTSGLDFAAAFGPVRGLKGEVVFTDLLNLTTAPDQIVTIAAINPGIEVLAGTVQFEVKDGMLLALEDARFPLMGGTLVMRPLVMDFSQPEERRYVFEISGLDAARFVAEMELSNLSATGIFDGTVPIVFDKDGRGRIDNGILVAREGGGNLAYIGELTYEDLGTMGNYAFSALRSLDYRQMRVGLGGQLDGEIVTSFEYDGVRQGAGTSSNFVTRRLARLPILFKVNVRSENFYQLTTMVRSFWDIDFLGSPVDRGLLKAEDGRFVPANPARPTLPGAIQPVQPAESESQP